MYKQRVVLCHRRLVKDRWRSFSQSALFIAFGKVLKNNGWSEK